MKILVLPPPLNLDLAVAASKRAGGRTMIAIFEVDSREGGEEDDGLEAKKRSGRRGNNWATP